MLKNIFMLILFYNFLFSSNLIVENSGQLDTFTVDYYLDKTKIKTIDEIEKIEFIDKKPSQFSLGYLKGTSWFKFRIENRSDTEDIVINFTEAFYDTLNLYEYKNNRWIKHKDGIATPQEQKEIKGVNPAFLVKLQKGETSTYYLQTSSSFPLFGEIEVFKFVEYMTEKRATINSLYMFYFGGLFIIIIFNIFLYITLKDIIYAYYVGYTFFYVMFVFILTGFNNIVNLENYYYEFHISPPFLMLFFVLFTCRLLEVEKYSKFLFQLLKITAGILLIMSVLIVFDLQKWYQVVTSFATVVFSTLFITTLYVWFKGNAIAKFYFAALSIYLICMVLFTSMANGWIENNNINRYLFLYASFFEIIFFSLLLANRFNRINKEKVVMQEKLIKSLRCAQEQEKRIQQQSRLAQMGEMISMIAHQWRQPLGAISSAVFGIQTKIASGRYNLSNKEDKEEFLVFLNQKHKNINEYVQFLSTTVDDFRNFFKPDKAKEYISINQPIVKALKIVQSSMESKGIIIQIDFTTEDYLFLYQNEMIQVILNILKNSEDNFLDKKTINPNIMIATSEQNNQYSISIEDNGGGIEDDIVLNIFEPYFSTKDERNGTGLGLYMSKMIVEDHHGGKLEVKNTQHGVCFTLVFIKKEEE